MSNSEPFLSACLIVRNEEDNLARCLSSLDGLADEIVVVDTGSTDRTVEIAESYGARVFHEPWTDDFSFHRNQSLDRATGDWRLVVDADEEVVETDKIAARRQLASCDKNACMVMEKLLLADGSFQVVVLPRLIRAGAGIKYHMPIHEQLTAHQDIDASLSLIRLLHHGYDSRQQTVAKQERNLAIAMRIGDTIHGLHSQLRACLTLDRYDQAMDTAMKLIGMKLSPGLEAEVCAMGGAVAARTGNHTRLAEFVEIGRELAERGPDLLLLEFLEVGMRYAQVVEEFGAQDELVAHLRAPVFRHNLPGIKKLLNHMGGMRRPDGGMPMPTENSNVVDQG